MTSTGDGTNAENERNAARGALEAVAALLNTNVDATHDDLRSIPSYGAIPEELRETLEALTPAERNSLKSVLTTLAQHPFYRDLPIGSLWEY